MVVPCCHGWMSPWSVTGQRWTMTDAALLGSQRLPLMTPRSQICGPGVWDRPCPPSTIKERCSDLRRAGA
uniref:Uncharacterized protein n=1 Tax=Setaria italica TaxID=4555 RepID=K4APK0_SETIT